MKCSKWNDQVDACDVLWLVCYLCLCPCSELRAVYWPRRAPQNYLKITRDLMILTDVRRWRHRLTCRLSLLNCLVILWQQVIKKQRWPTKVPLYLTGSKTTSLPSLLSPTCQRDTEWKSGKDSYCRVSQTQHRRGPDHTAGRRNRPLTKSGAHDSFITSLTVSRVSTACLWSDNLNIEGVLEFLLSIKMVNGKWFL